jgi:hypothetical protein
LDVTHYYDIIFISENTVYTEHVKKLSVNEKEYKYFDLPSLGPGYGKYKCVCVFVYTQNVQLKAEAAYRIHKPTHRMYANILYL